MHRRSCPPHRICRHPPAISGRRPRSIEQLPARSRHSTTTLINRETPMFRPSMIRRIRPLAVILAGLSCASLASADDMVSFATGGYARGLRTMDEMHKIDTDGDGSVSKAEWLAYQEKVWSALDKDKNGTIDEKEFLAP